MITEGGWWWDPATTRYKALPLPPGTVEFHKSSGAMSPDGQWLWMAARRNGSWQFGIWRMRPDGTDPVEVLVGAESFTQPSLNRDGTELVAVAAGLAGRALIRLRLESGAINRLSTEAAHPVFTPDGTHIVYLRYGITGYDIALAPVAGGPERILEQGGGHPPIDFDLTPDGEFAIIQFGTRFSTDRYCGCLGLVSLQTGEVLPLGFGRGAVTTR